MNPVFASIIIDKELVLYVDYETKGERNHAE